MSHYSLTPALSVGQLDSLREPHWQADINISLCDNVLAFSAQLNATLPTVSGATAAVLTYTSAISGSYTNIDEGMVVVVSPTSDPRYPTAVRLRARLDGSAAVVADATHVYVNEYSDIFGLGSYIFAYYSYDLIDSLSRPTGTSPSIVQYEDYNHSFATPAPVIRGSDSAPLQTAYASYVDSAGHYDIPFAATGTFSPNPSASISSYLYTVKPTGSGTATVIAGSAATASVTYRFTAGEYWVKLVVTDSLGVTNFRHILVKAHSDAYPPQDGFEGAEITRDIQQGPSGRVKYYDGVSTLLNGTMAVFWMKELYSDLDFSDSATSLLGNIALIGWIETEEDQFMTDPTYSAYSEVSFEVQGIGARLARIEGQLLAITNSASPTAWDQLKNLTPWRAVVHFLQQHTQALHLCDFTADDLTDGYLFPTITTIAGNALDNVSGQQGIGWQIRSALAFARDGRILLEVRADFDPTYSADLVTVATWTNEDIVGQATLKLNQYVQYGFINADGACWGGGAAAPVPCLSRAPGLAQASGVDQGQFNNQILTTGQIPAAAQAQLNGFAGTMFAVDNNTTELTVTHPDGYWWIETSFSQLYLFTFTFDVRGISLGNSYWMVKSVTHRHDNKTGASEVQVVYIPVVSGFPGATVPIINNTALTPPPIIPAIPAFNFELPETTIPGPGLPPSPTTPPTTDRQGEIVLEVNNSGAALSIAQDYILHSSPSWRNYTPSPLPTGYVLTQALFDQLGSTGGTVAVYALINNGTNSIIAYNANVLSASSAWSFGASFTGVYQEIRASGTPGSVLVWAPASGSGSGTVNITYLSGSGAATANIGDTIVMSSALIAAGTNPPSHLQNLTFTLSQCCQISIVAESGFQGYSLTGDNLWNIFNCNGTTTPGPATPSSQTLINFPSHVALDELAIDGNAQNPDGRSGIVFSASIKFEALTNPGGSGLIRFSSDYGATVGSAVTVGTSPGIIGGFDLIRNGGVSYAATDTTLKKASTLGGAYSAFCSLGAVPTSVAIPYYQVGSDTTVQTSSSSPQVVVGLSAEVAGSCLYWIDGSGTKTAITTPVAGCYVNQPDQITMLRGTKLAVIVMVSGVPKLYVTENLNASGTATWTLVTVVGPQTTLRSRRNDPRTGSHKGQLYTFAPTESGYSSQWAHDSEWPRTSPDSGVLGGDILG